MTALWWRRAMAALAKWPEFSNAECRVEIIQGGHWGMLDHPDDVNRLMLEWFEAPISAARRTAT